MTALVHEPAAPVERVEDGVPTRTSSGRVRPGAPGLNVYVLALLHWQRYAPEVAEGFTRERVWLEPTDDGWCRYTVTDRQARAAPGRRSRARG
jgi:hypothetical protein